MRAVRLIVAVVVVVLALAALSRIMRVKKAAAEIPLFAGAREGGGRTRYLPRLISWDDRSSARVQRVFALPQATSLVTIARLARALTAQMRPTLAAVVSRRMSAAVLNQASPM